MTRSGKGKQVRETKWQFPHKYPIKVIFDVNLGPLGFQIHSFYSAIMYIMQL